MITVDLMTQTNDELEQLAESTLNYIGDLDAKWSEAERIVAAGQASYDDMAHARLHIEAAASRAEGRLEAIREEQAVRQAQLDAYKEAL